MATMPGVGAAVVGVSLSVWLLRKWRRGRDRFIFEDYEWERTHRVSSSGGSGRVYHLQNERRSTVSDVSSSVQQQQEEDTPASVEEAGLAPEGGQAPQPSQAVFERKAASSTVVKERLKEVKERGQVFDGRQLRAREAEHVVALTKAHQEAQQLRAQEKKQAVALCEVQQELREMQKQRKQHISALEEAQQDSVQLRTMNRNLVAQVEQLESVLRNVSGRESYRVQQLETELAEATSLVSRLEAECEMLEAIASTESEEGSRRTSETDGKASMPSPPTPPGTDIEGRRKELYPTSGSRASRVVDFGRHSWEA